MSRLVLRGISLGLVILTLLALSVSGSGAGGAGATISTSAAPRAISSNLTSSNWAGYAALESLHGTVGSVSEVQGTWTEPTANCTSGRTTYASFWVGIDGYSSSTVEQTGTDSDCSGSTAHYYAWYEFYPANSVTISTITVHPGDTITAKVAYLPSTGKFRVTLTDGSHTFTTTGKVTGAKRSSAEWIAETPEVCTSSCALSELSKFGTVHFRDCRATINGTSGAISAFPQVSHIDLRRGTVTLAATSALKAPGAFTVTWKAYL